MSASSSDNFNEEVYCELLTRCLSQGEFKQDRTGVGTYSTFGLSASFHVREIPILTAKKIHIPSVVHELIWFLKGDTNTRYLKDNKVSIWDEWADSNGDLGPIYGHQWRNWNSEGIDQIKSVINSILSNPYSRRHIVSAWNPSQIPSMALPPCHTLFQFHASNTIKTPFSPIHYKDSSSISNELLSKLQLTYPYIYVHNRASEITKDHFLGSLSLQLYLRSSDLFLGLPFNILSYALLLYVIAYLTRRVPDRLVINIGDAHIYSNHTNQVKTYIDRVYKDQIHIPPLFYLTPFNGLDDLSYSNFNFFNYKSEPAIKAPIAV